MRIALQIEKSRAHGRALLTGIADYALERTDWRLELVEPERHVRSFAYCGFGGLRFSDARGEAFRTCAEADGCACSVFGSSGHAQIDDTFFRDEKTDPFALGRMAAEMLDRLFASQGQSGVCPGIGPSDQEGDPAPAFASCVCDAQGHRPSVRRGRRPVRLPLPAVFLALLRRGVRHDARNLA